MMSTHISNSLVSGATPVGSGFFSTNTRPTLLETVECSGMEETLRQCRRNASKDGECTHDAAVVCQGEYYHISFKYSLYTFLRQAVQ